jgi:hypothetical protein
MVLAVAACAIMLEVFCRAWLLPRTGDIAAIVGLDARMRSAAAGPDPVVLLLGDSTVEANVDAAELQRALRGLTREAVKLVPVSVHGSTMAEWRYMAERCVATHATAPDVIVIPFFACRASDSAPPDIARLALCLVSNAYWPVVARAEHLGAGQRIELAASTYSCAFALRQRLRLRALAALVPYYHRYMDHPLLGGSRQEHTSPGGSGYARLRSLARAAERAGTGVCMVAIPWRDQPARLPCIPPSLVNALRTGRGSVADLRGALAAGEPPFQDEAHMTAEGRRRFTPVLARAIAPCIRKWLSDRNGPARRRSWRGI